jgi:hypothetical protein
VEVGPPRGPQLSWKEDLTLSKKSTKKPEKKVDMFGLRVIGPRQLKSFAKRAFFRGVDAARSDLSQMTRDRLTDVFEAWWRANG